MMNTGHHNILHLALLNHFHDSNAALPLRFPLLACSFFFLSVHLLFIWKLKKKHDNTVIVSRYIHLKHVQAVGVWQFVPCACIGFVIESLYNRFLLRLKRKHVEKTGRQERTCCFLEHLLPYLL